MMDGRCAKRDQMRNDMCVLVLDAEIQGVKDVWVSVRVEEVCEAGSIHKGCSTRKLQVDKRWDV